MKKVTFHDLARKSWKHIKEIEELGGMIKAIESGIPKINIEYAATKKQARIDDKKDMIIGINTNKIQKEENNLNILEVNNAKVRNSQIKRFSNQTG